MTILDAQQWTAFLTSRPQTHILQTSAWGEFKAGFGWKPVRVQAGESGAQILLRRLPLGLSFAYIPKGPLGDDWQALWPEIDRVCRQNRAIFLKIEPDAWEGAAGHLAPALAGFIPARPVQPYRTVLIDLSGSEEDWLARMKQKTRYNIRLAQRKEVVVQPSSDIAAFQRMMQVTGARDGFGVHSLEYYQKAYRAFTETDNVALLMAEYQGQLLAGLMVFAAGQTAWYFYGASTNEERNRMPTYLLQFEAMRWAAARGCLTYDLWGIPDLDEQELEAHFSEHGDGLWGVYRFKRGFGGEIFRTAGAWDKVYFPALYRLYLMYLRRRGSEE